MHELVGTNSYISVHVQITLVLTLFYYENKYKPYSNYNNQIKKCLSQLIFLVILFGEVPHDDFFPKAFKLPVKNSNPTKRKQYLHQKQSQIGS